MVRLDFRRVAPVTVISGPSFAQSFFPPRKIGQFLEVWVFPAAQAGLCVDGPCKAAGHLQNTPRTPAMHFPLGASGSQSALYARTRAHTPSRTHTHTQAPIHPSIHPYMHPPSHPCTCGYLCVHIPVCAWACAFMHLCIRLCVVTRGVIVHIYLIGGATIVRDSSMSAVLDGRSHGHSTWKKIDSKCARERGA